MKNIASFMFLIPLFMLTGCGTVLPEMPEIVVTDTKPTPNYLKKVNTDPIDTGEAKGFKPDAFTRIDVDTPYKDYFFGTMHRTRNDFADTQGKPGITVNGKKIIDQEGDIDSWSKVSNTGFLTYRVRINQPRPEDTSFALYKYKTIDLSVPNAIPQVVASFTKGRQHPPSWMVPGISDNQSLYYPLITSKGVVAFTKDKKSVTYIELGHAPITSLIPNGYKPVTHKSLVDIAYSKHLRIIQHRESHKLLGFVPSSQEQIYDMSFLNLTDGSITATALGLVIDTTNNTRFINYIDNAVKIINTESGPLVVSVEDVLKKTIVRNLATLDKKTLVSTKAKQGHEFRAGFETRQDGGMGEYGKAWIKFSIANGDMSNKTIKDLELWILNQP